MGGAHARADRAYTAHVVSHLAPAASGSPLSPDPAAAPGRQVLRDRLPDFREEGRPLRDVRELRGGLTSKHVAFDPATGKRVRSTLTGSVTIPPQVDIVKHLQRHPWGSEAWVKAYGQRNHVESSNKHLKDGRFTDLGDPKKRAGRGYAFQFLASSIAVVASSIRRIVTALRRKAREAREATTPKTRKPRRQLAPVRTAVVDPIDAVGTRGAPPG
ncbi:hypothetical protein GCM10022202_18740 [Microbacterium marinilacus]|uniref:Transposase n=2 Tax=Microbacterium marinilacus TaxID=415209 RepID=A0ABP7BEN2_9MICO